MSKLKQPLSDSTPLGRMMHQMFWQTKAQALTRELEEARGECEKWKQRAGYAERDLSQECEENERVRGLLKQAKRDLVEQARIYSGIAEPEYVKRVTELEQEAGRLTGLIRNLYINAGGDKRETSTDRELFFLDSLVRKLRARAPVKVEERLPTKNDADPDGEVEVWVAGCWPRYRWDDTEWRDAPEDYPHWRKIDNTPPEEEG